MAWPVAHLYSAEPPAGGASATNSVETKAVSPDAGAGSVKKRLTGAELYSIHCNRCHAERYPTERTAAQWKTIMLHMQVRANIPGQQARQILQYLQENSGR
jgi:cytochrome c5